MNEDIKPDTVKPSGRRAQTRSAILLAGERLLADDFDSVSIDDLVAAADVAKGTFYNHFTDKADLFQAVVSGVREDLRSSILKETEGVDDPARVLVRGFCIAVRYLLLKPHRRRFLLASQRVLMSHLDDTDAGVVSLIAQGVAQGRFRITTVESGVLLNFGLIQICAAFQFNEKDSFATIARVQQLGAMLLRGLGIPYDETEVLGAQEADRIIRPICSVAYTGRALSEENRLVANEATFSS